MSTPLSDVRSREPTVIPSDLPIRVRFSGVRVFDPILGREVEVAGPVDLTRYHDVPFDFTNARTGLADVARGIALHVIEEDGVAVDRYWNLISKRAIERLKPDLASGAYLHAAYVILASGSGPKKTYDVTRQAVPPQPPSALGP